MLAREREKRKQQGVMEPSNSCVDPLKPSSSRKQRLGLINRSRQRDRRRPAAVKGGRGLRPCAGIPKRHTRIDSLCCLLLRCLCVEWSCLEGASYKLSSVEFHVGRRGEDGGVARARFSSCHRAHRVARPRLLFDATPRRRQKRAARPQRTAF